MIGGIITLLALLGFLAVVIWVFLVKNREDFRDQAELPLEDGERKRARHEDRPADAAGTEEKDS
ncbi:MAG: cbb3-type cytochrome c oxidase subunit 3 [Wenzhouxiangellaceae bacterium]|nr:cbb3-type cytochrome c oxidase subunit 3 [Wenzhouxiangellaceae bacterium]